MGGIVEELVKLNQHDYFKNNVMPLIRPIKRMEQRGILIDHLALANTRRRLALESKVLQGRLDQLVDYRVNVKSTPDKQWLLYNYLKLRPNKRTGKGGQSTDEDSIRALRYSASGRVATILDLLLATVERRTFLSGFLNLETDEEGRYHASYLIHGTDTGRLSSRSGATVTGKRGPQLQNIPKPLRHIFIARDGYSIVEADLAKAEAMYVAYDAEEEWLIDVFNRGDDPYCIWATSVLHRTVVKGSIEREAFKQASHASHYGMGPFRYIRVLRLKGINIEDLDIKGLSRPLAKAKYILESYHDRCPNIRKWQNKLLDEVKKTRTLHDSLGRRRFFMGRLTEINPSFYRPQATVGGLTNEAFVKLDKEGWELILQVHDSIAIECPDERIAECKAAYERAFNHPITLHGRTFNIPIEIKVGKNWRDAV